MNCRTKIFLSILFSVSAFIATAQVPKQLDLKQSIDLSIKNSGAIHIADARILQASAEVRAAKDRALPDAKISGSYLRLSGANVDLKNNNGGGTKAPTVNQAIYGIANITYPIYAGGRIRYGIESAKYLEQAVKLNAENDKEAIIYNTILAYANLYKAGKTVSVIEESLKASIQRDTTFSRLEQNGLLTRNDLLKSQLQTSNIELSLLDAQSDLSIANVNMALMLGLPEETKFIIDSSFVSAKQDLLPFLQTERLALEKRKDIQALGFERKAAALGVKSAKAETYPSLALTGGYIAADIPKFISITNAVNVGIGLQYDLSSLWKTNTKLQQARVRETILSVNESQINDAVRLQVNIDYQNYLLTQKKIEVFDKAIAQAQENYRITKNKYDNSLVTITDLLEADVALLQTKLKAASARADAALAYNKLLQTTGTL